jgi:hypothetical protein
MFFAIGRRFYQAWLGLREVLQYGQQLPYRHAAIHQYVSNTPMGCHYGTTAIEHVRVRSE